MVVPFPFVVDYVFLTFKNQRIFQSGPIKASYGPPKTVELTSRGCTQHTVMPFCVFAAIQRLTLSRHGIAPGNAPFFGNPTGSGNACNSIFSTALQHNVLYNDRTLHRDVMNAGFRDQTEFVQSVTNFSIQTSNPDRTRVRVGRAQNRWCICIFPTEIDFYSLRRYQYGGLFFFFGTFV